MLLNANKLFSLLILIALSWASPIGAEVLVYGGMTVGSAESSINDQFNASDGMYAFIGIQTEYYVTYEAGAARLHTDQPTSANDYKTALVLLTASVLGHLPISDSSLFARIGAGVYQYYDNSGVLQDIYLPTYGAGIDLGIIPRMTIRLEWLRYTDLEMNHINFDIETISLGAFYYF